MEKTISRQKNFYQTGQTKEVSNRIQKLKSLRKEIKSNRESIIEALYKDFKKPRFETLTSEIGVVLDELDLHIRKLKKWQRPEKVFPHISNFYSRDRIYREPYGQVLIISPWNYPFNLAMIPLIGAISGGNTVVLKPSEYSPHTAQIIEKIIDSVFEKEYVNVVQGDAQTAQALLKEKWDYIFFTGSPAVGKYVYEAAAKHLTPVTLELGGKSPVVIDETADLPVAARRIVWGKFYNAGQTCIAPDYVLLPTGKKDEFIDLAKREIEKMYGKDPQKSPDYARIINAKNFRRLRRMMENQKIVVGGGSNEEDNYIAPTIVLNPDKNSELMLYEIFGPVLPVITYHNMKVMEAFLQAHPDPLAFYIFSNNKKFQKYLVDKYAFGGGMVNDVLGHFVNPRLPFGGVGNSGMGNYHGKYSFDTFTRPKSMVYRSNWPDVFVRYAPVTALKEKIIRFLFGI